MREREKVLGAALSEALGFVDAEARASLEEVASRAAGRLRPWRGAACAKMGASTRRIRRPAELVPIPADPLVRREGFGRPRKAPESCCILEKSRKMLVKM